jgi:lysophospholipase L1-like esterase
VRYVALGDSYTIGTSVAEADAWPSQLVARLDPQLNLAANLGVNGYATADLIRDELPEVAALNPGLVTVQIGVNDVVRGVAESTYATNVETILSTLLDILPADRIVAVATPDYTLTPAGAGFGDPVSQRARIVRFNLVLSEAAARHEIAFVTEPFAISAGVVGQPQLVASDGLHPSGAQYRLWVNAIAPVVADLLGAIPSDS